MLCGEFQQSLPLALNLRVASVTTVRNPYLTLLALAEGMATFPINSQEDEEDIYLENGLMSYENPNYHFDSARLDDALNSNTEDNIYEDIYQNIDDICNMVHGIKSSLTNNVSARKTYASLGIDSMGVDIKNGPLMKRDHDNTDNKGLNEITQTNDNQEKDIAIEHVTGNINNDLYAVPVKRRQKKSHLIETQKESKELEDISLPPGWEKHEDNDGPYYWHIKSGTIQREIPMSNVNDDDKTNINNFLNSADELITSYENSICAVTRSSTSSALDIESEEKRIKESQSYKRRSYPAKFEQELKEKPIRFAVRSLGWVEISEEDLTPERSSKAVNKCIVDLSVGKNDLLDVVGRWGDGKDLFMDLDEGALKLIDPENITVLNTQPIHTIRVWGVGRDNGRDFAYVARDRSTRKHMCHVFRCDMPARTIANTLRDICKKIMIERSLQQNLGKTVESGRTMAIRPTNLPTEHRRPIKNGIVTHSFPTPMEEPKKILRAQYLGSTQVTQATGMDILNEAIDRLVASVSQDQWQFVNVAVAPSMITIQLPNDELLAECRVRYLSFLGIGKIVKYCAFIMHTSEDKFIAHAFYCEPSSGALCKTIEAACKLRYQKCLDAHPQGFETSNANLNTPSKSIGAALKSLVGSFTKRKTKSSDS